MTFKQERPYNRDSSKDNPHRETFLLSHHPQSWLCQCHLSDIILNDNYVYFYKFSFLIAGEYRI